MPESTTPRHPHTVRVDLLRAHGSPTLHLYSKGCRCGLCKAANAEKRRHERANARRPVAGMSTVRVNLLRAHGTRYRYTHGGCRCSMCHVAMLEYSRLHVGVVDHDKMAKRGRRHYENNREQVAERGRKRRRERPEELAEYAHLYFIAHRAKYAADHHAYNARKLGNGGTHTGEDVQAQHVRQRGKCFWCGKKVGNRYHVDHVIPISTGGSNGPENLVISCPTCNLRKHDKHPMDFAGVML